ncbi:MAG: DUF1697 domain-containing protein [Anaerolineae bacterium]|nr:DUF1697 domain-containing protein [Anaerolineae bacterium]
MPKYVAFLRAINVGGHTVKMDHLRRLFEAMGFTNVETFIASGNVIFESTEPDKKALERQIEEALQAALGYAVATFNRTTAELGEIARYKPFKEPDADSHNLYVAFLGDTPGEAAQQKLLAFTTEIDEFKINGTEVYWLCRKKMSESQFSGALLEKTLGMPATMRNITTVKKMAAKYA